jgi:ankyrin repeat protein
LEWAINADNTELVQLLLERGADVNAHGGYPLLTAADRGDIEIATLLIAHGAQTDFANDADVDTAVHQAARGGHIDVLKLLLAKGAKVDAKGVNQSTPLLLAAADDHNDCVEFLLSKGADPNTGDIEGCTPLHYAANVGYTAPIETLLAHGADINRKNKAGQTPLQFIIANKANQPASEALLRRHGGK